MKNRDEDGTLSQNTILSKDGTSPRVGTAMQSTLTQNKTSQRLKTSQPLDAAKGEKRPKKAKTASASEENSYLNCLLQAEICCEQARDAARLKRMEAACGLFSTAQSLLRRAIETGGEACFEARERLSSISSEMAAYCELSRAQSRSTHHLPANSLKSAGQPAPVRVPAYSPPNYRR